MAEQSHTEQSESGPTILGRPAPTFLGLCPMHGEEFYFPFEESVRPMSCPEPDCGRALIVYERCSS